MPEQRILHLYLVFDDWNSGYSIRKVRLSRRSGKQPSSSDSSGEDDCEQPALPSGPGKGAKPLRVFMRVPAQRGFPQLFTSAYGTKIMAMHQRALVDDMFVGVAAIDVLDWTCTFEAQGNAACTPIYFPVSDDRLFALDIGTFEVLQKPERSGQPWVWQGITPCPPFDVWDVSSYGVQPDGCILVSTKNGVTFIFDTKAKQNVWKLYSHWVFPFTGRGHYDSCLKGFVGLSKDPKTLGYLYCCTMDSTVTGGIGKVHATYPDLKCTKHTLYSPVEVHNVSATQPQHVSATLVHMRPGKFCLVECVCIDVSKRSTDPEFNGPPSVDSVGGGPQGGRFMYRLKTFSLSIMKEDLKIKNSKVRCYSLPHEARIGTIRRDPVAFWL